MNYFAELYYFEKKRIVYRQALTAIVQTVGLYCNYYRAEIIDPKKNVQCRTKFGKLPALRSDKKEFIQKLIDWIISNSELENIFALFLDIDPIDKQKSRKLKFDHHDDTCCWRLNLSILEFEKLKSELQKNNLPEDLFYPQGKGRCISYKPFKNKTGKFWDLMNSFFAGWQKCYTPKRWEEKQKKT